MRRANPRTRRNTPPRFGLYIYVIINLPGTAALLSWRPHRKKSNTTSAKAETLATAAGVLADEKLSLNTVPVWLVSSPEMGYFTVLYCTRTGNRSQGREAYPTPPNLTEMRPNGLVCNSTTTTTTGHTTQAGVFARRASNFGDVPVASSLAASGLV